MAALKWTEPALREAATGCKTKAEFRRKNGNGACKAAHAAGLLSELFGEDVRNFRSDADVIGDAQRFKTKVEFKQKSYAAYQIACKRKLIDLCGFVNQKESWTDAKIRAIASKYSTFADFIEGDHAAYQAASIRGLLDTLGMRSRTGKYAGSADTIYVWRAVGQTLRGIPIYKIGVTSSGQGSARVARVSAKSGFDFDVIFFENVGAGNAYRVERLLHRVGENPNLTGFDGCSEFRALTATQLETILDILVDNICNQQ